MAAYELVREIPNLCKNNQMRDVFIEEVETDDPAAYVRSVVKDMELTLSREVLKDGTVVIYAQGAGLFQKFSFTPVSL